MSAAPILEGCAACCGLCRHFDNRPETVEQLIPGLRTMGSGYSSVKSRDGICRLHDRYLAAEYHCPSFQEATVTA
ncbi:MAG: hypothetical protein KGJ15_07250 [Betaproteobacteria bacterium]|nr:hypothetical protein [Betaproteobacteria bacterium]MDE2132543.1 hypothetical protein [Betaproteobacteria bacterium]MDE2212786.1 hypothetical protein [Betaproteobacteria bacterium]